MRHPGYSHQHFISGLQTGNWDKATQAPFWKHACMVALTFLYHWQAFSTKDELKQMIVILPTYYFIDTSDIVIAFNRTTLR